MRRLLTVAALAAFAWPVLALGGGDGFRCQNECPLAKVANAHRAYGMEALAASPIAQAELYREVERNLARI